MWSGAREKILTIDNLIQCRQVFMNWRCMRKGDGKSVSHLLVRCPLAWVLWTELSSLMVWVFPVGVEDLLYSWEAAKVRKGGRGFG